MPPSLEPASDEESDDGLGDLEELSIRGGTPLQARREPQDEADEDESYYCDMCAETIAGTRYGLISAAAWLAKHGEEHSLPTGPDGAPRPPAALLLRPAPLAAPR